MANRPRNNKFKSRIPRSSRNQQRIPKGGIKKRVGGNRNNNKNVKNKVADARQKIISKKRNTVRDARDILAKMAKNQDARSKLLKMREARKGENVSNTKIRAISTNIYQRTDRNGKISLITSRNKQSTNDINLAIQQQLGLIQNRKKSSSRQSSSSSVSPVSRKSASRRGPQVLISKTILNDDYHTLPIQSAYDSFPHNYINADSVASSRMVGSPLLTRRQQLHDYADGNDWQTYSSFGSRGRIQPSGYIDLDAPEDEEMPLVSPIKQTIFMQGTSRSSNVHSRLDTNPTENQSHGIFAVPTKTKVVVPAGHRIVVSNLQQTVTQDDIRELFEDIGQLLAARLVRPGTAEVIYKNLKDAQKAVDTYHNRQLDGQPMKCLLVNKRPLNNPTGPPLTTSKQDPTGLILAKKNAVAKNTEKLVPDLQTIHKVLFQRN